jgi:hypothetical protein
MAETLKETREAWEEGEEVVAEFYVKNLDALVVLFRHINKDTPTHAYGLVRYFRLGDGWGASMDATEGGHERGLVKCIKTLAKLMDEDVAAFEGPSEPKESRFVGTEADIEFVATDEPCPKCKGVVGHLPDCPYGAASTKPKVGGGE